MLSTCSSTSEPGIRPPTQLPKAASRGAHHQRHHQQEGQAQDQAERQHAAPAARAQMPVGLSFSGTCQMRSSALCSSANTVVAPISSTTTLMQAGDQALGRLAGAAHHALHRDRALAPDQAAAAGRRSRPAPPRARTARRRWRSRSPAAAPARTSCSTRSPRPCWARKSSIQAMTALRQRSKSCLGFIMAGRATRQPSPAPAPFDQNAERPQRTRERDERK